MIQRIQSVFLLLAALAFAGKLFAPVATAVEEFGTIMADGVFQTTESLWLTIFALVGLIVSFFNIFLYRRRKSQMRFLYDSQFVCHYLGSRGLLYGIGAGSKGGGDNRNYSFLGIFANPGCVWYSIAWPTTLSGRMSDWFAP
jgi:hypothetical protein